MPSHTEIGEFIWRIADHLRGDYEKNDNEDVILPFTLLRRLDCVLDKTRDKVRETEAKVVGKVTDDVLKKLLVGAAGVPFYNRSKFSFTELLKDPANIKENFGSYLEGFSDNIKEILYNFSGGEEKGLAPIYETLARKNLLYLITKEFSVSLGKPGRPPPSGPGFFVMQSTQARAPSRWRPVTATSNSS